MNFLTTYQPGLLHLEELLFPVVLLIIFVAFLFFVMTLYKKIERIKELKQREKYQELVDQLLFRVLFSDQSVQQVISSSAFQEYFTSQLYQRISIRTIVALHHSYSGTYSRKLEQFYEESGLVKYSLSKLNAQKWPFIVEGIRDLSSLNYQKAYPRIVSHQNHPNTFVQTEVLLGMIKLKGISEILKFRNRNVFLNDWVQSNILFAVKNHKIDAPKNLTELLQSKNKSILLLVVRLIDYYKSAVYYDHLSSFYQSTTDVRLKKEIALVLRKTEQLQ